MALFKYLKLKQRDTMKTYSECFPDASGPLVITMPIGSITAANSSVTKVLEKQEKQAETKRPQTRGEYQIYTAEERAQIGKRVAIYSINSTIKYYNKINPERPPLLSCSVFDLKLKYREDLPKEYAAKIRI